MAGVRKGSVLELLRRRTAAFVAAGSMVASLAPAVLEARTSVHRAMSVAVTAEAEDPSHTPTGSDSLDGARPAVRDAYRRAERSAHAAGVRFTLVSAARDAAHQQVLFDQAVRAYGSRAEARKWVLPPGESEHVRGGAVDVTPRAAARWLEDNGSRFGLCRRYDNEWWHFELLTRPGATCPPRQPYAGS